MVRLELITVPHPCEAVVWVSHLGDSGTAHPAACLVGVYRDFFLLSLLSTRVFQKHLTPDCQMALKHSKLDR